MEYKYSTINEVNHFEFGEAVVGDIQLTERMFRLVKCTGNETNDVHHNENGHICKNLSGKFLQPRHPDDAYQ